MNFLNFQNVITMLYLLVRVNKTQIHKTMKYTFISVITFIWINAFSILFISINAQVTIGSGFAPKNGALLDLKEYNDATSQAGGRTTKRGVLLPRVALTTANSLVDIPEANAASTPLQYTGLVVYNVGTVTTISKGLNMWDGAKWVAVQSSLKTFLKATGGTNISIIDIDLIVGTSWKKIQFNSEEFDDNNEFNTTTSEFTVKQDGIYNIYAQFKGSTALLGAGNLGIGIIKKSASTGLTTLIAEESFVNISVTVVVPINVTPPTRKVQTLVKLQTGDVITVAANTSILSANLIGDTNSYFTIQQVK